MAKIFYDFRPSTTRSTPQPVMCGALVHSCMRYGVWDTNHLRGKQIIRCTVLQKFCTSTVRNLYMFIYTAMCRQLNL